MSDCFAGLSQEERDRLKAASQPEWISPMLATLTEERFSDPDWVFERKLDGERALAFREGQRVRLLSRNKKELDKTYPELVEALSAQSCNDFIIDGEVVAFEGKQTSFSRLQQRMQIKNSGEARATGVAVYYYLFDLLHLDGHDVTDLPLRARKGLLKKTMRFQDPLRYTAHRNERGQSLHKEACEKGWEGLIAKRADSTYQHHRSPDWLKFKCVKGQELVIGGFTEPKGSRIGFGALLVGYYEDGELRYAGKVGTGYDEETLQRLRKRLDRITRETSPFAGDVHEKGVTWVRPKLVGEFAFTEWTDDGKLRHPRYLGLRRDKDPKRVLREVGKS